MKAFGKEGSGIFIAPAAIEKEVRQQYQVKTIGQTNEVKEHFYAISVERKVKHPIVCAVIDAASESLFVNHKSLELN